MNVSRVFSKLSLFEKFLFDKMVPNEAFVRQAVRLLEVEGWTPKTSASSSPGEKKALGGGVGQKVVLRMSFVLGTMCANSERVRKLFCDELDGHALMGSLLNTYWERNRQAIIHQDSDMNKSSEETLTKIVGLHTLFVRTHHFTSL